MTSETAVLPIFLLLGIALLLAAVMMVVTFIFGPKNPSPEKLAPYECGIKEIEPPSQRFPVKYLVTGILFIVFDVEAVSFYPLAILLKTDLKMFGFIELLIFLIIMAIAYIYVWRKGAFNWE